MFVLNSFTGVKMLAFDGAFLEFTDAEGQVQTCALRPGLVDLTEFGKFAARYEVVAHNCASVVSLVGGRVRDLISVSHGDTAAASSYQPSPAVVAARHIHQVAQEVRRLDELRRSRAALRAKRVADPVPSDPPSIPAAAPLEQTPGKKPPTVEPSDPAGQPVVESSQANEVAQ